MLKIKTDKYPAGIQIFIYILFLFGGFMTIGQILGFLVALPFFQFDPKLMIEVLADMPANSNYIYAFYTMQLVTAVTGFILVPYFFLFVINGRSPKLEDFGKTNFRPIKTIILIVTMVVFMRLIMLPTAWNENFHFPAGLKWLETVFKTMEDRAMELTALFIDIKNFPQFLIAFVVMAIVPALGEELAFRGVLQPILMKKVGPHLSIWLTAFVFSAIHLQFYGFFPRMMLGAFFGYLVWHSNRLYPAILCHLINNGLFLTLTYAYSAGIIHSDIANLPTPGWIEVILLLIGFILGCYLYFRGKDE